MLEKNYQNNFYVELNYNDYKYATDKKDNSQRNNIIVGAAIIVIVIIVAVIIHDY